LLEVLSNLTILGKKKRGNDKAASDVQQVVRLEGC
jgi:hypothetical protein